MEGQVRNYEIGMNGAMEMNCGLGEQIAIIDELGYDWIEFRDWSVAEYLQRHEMGELLALLAAARVKPLSVNAIMPITLGQGDDRERLKGQARRCLELAATLGAPYVVACCYVGSEGFPRAEGARRVIQGIELVSDLAGDFGIKVAYEPLGNVEYPIHTIADTMDLLRTVDRDNVGWLFDTYHFHTAGDSLEALAGSDLEKLYFVHIDDVKDLPYERLAVLTERLLPGDGVCDLAGMLATLRGVGYEGPFSVEMANKEFLSWDPREFALVAKQKTEAVLDRYFL